MEFTERLPIIAAATGAILLLGIVTGSLFLYAVVLLLIAVVAVDAGRIYLLGQRSQGILVRRVPSDNKTAPWSPIEIETILKLPGGSPVQFTAVQELDEAFLPVWGEEQYLALQRGIPAHIFTTIMPVRHGELTIPPLKGVLETVFFRQPIRLGKSLHVTSYPAQEPRQAPAIANVAADGGDGTLFILLDADQSMGGGRPVSGLDTAISYAASLANAAMARGQEAGLICFTAEDAIRIVPPQRGREQADTIAEALIEVQPSALPGRPVPGRTMSAADVNAMGHALTEGPLAPLATVFAGTRREYDRRSADNGLVRSVAKAIAASRDACHIVVVTNLSPGMGGLAKAVALAAEHHCTVTVALMPWIRYDGNLRGRGLSGGSGPGRQNAIDKIVSMGAMVTDLAPQDKSGEVQSERTRDVQ